jgi:hypothetical protein
MSKREVRPHLMNKREVRPHLLSKREVRPHLMSNGQHGPAHRYTTSIPDEPFFSGFSRFFGLLLLSANLKSELVTIHTITCLMDFPSPSAAQIHTNEHLVTYGLIIRNVNFQFLSYRAARNYTQL